MSSSNNDMMSQASPQAAGDDPVVLSAGQGSAGAAAASRGRASLSVRPPLEEFFFNEILSANQVAQAESRQMQAALAQRSEVILTNIVERLEVFMEHVVRRLNFASRLDSSANLAFTPGQPTTQSIATPPFTAWAGAQKLPSEDKDTPSPPSSTSVPLPSSDLVTPPAAPTPSPPPIKAGRNNKVAPKPSHNARGGASGGGGGDSSDGSSSSAEDSEVLDASSLSSTESEDERVTRTRRTSLLARQVQAADSVPKDRVNTYESTPSYDHIHLHELKLPAVDYFIKSVTEYASTHNMFPKVTSFISEEVKLELLSHKRYRRITRVEFNQLPFSAITDMLVREVRPATPLHFYNHLDKLRFPRLPDSYIPDHSNFHILYRKILVFRLNFVRVYEILATKNHKNVPLTNDKELGLIRVFNSKIPFSFGKKIYLGMKKKTFNTIYEYLSVFLKEVDRHRKVTKQTEHLANQFGGTEYEAAQRKIKSGEPLARPNYPAKSNLHNGFPQRRPGIEATNRSGDNKRLFGSSQKLHAFTQRDTQEHSYNYYDDTFEDVDTLDDDTDPFVEYADDDAVQQPSRPSVVHNTLLQHVLTNSDDIRQHLDNDFSQSLNNSVATAPNGSSTQTEEVEDFSHPQPIASLTAQLPKAAGHSPTTPRQPCFSWLVMGRCNTSNCSYSHGGEECVKLAKIISERARSSQLSHPRSSHSDALQGTQMQPTRIAKPTWEATSSKSHSS